MANPFDIAPSREPIDEENVRAPPLAPEAPGSPFAMAAPPPPAAPAAPLSQADWAANMGTAPSSRAAAAAMEPAGIPSEPAPAPAAAPSPPTAPPPKPRPAGGAAAAAPGAETKGEKAAHAVEQKTDTAALETAKAGTEVGQRKAEAEQHQAEAEQQRIQAHYDDVDRRTSEGLAYLQAQQDKVANYKIKGMFDGRTGASMAAALMEGLGAFGAALTHGPNMASAVFERGKQEFRQKQLDELEGLNKGVTNAKDRIELTRMELASREAGMFKRLAADRAANIARFGGDEAKVAGDKIYNELAGHQAEAERTYQSMLHTRGDQEKLQASEIAKNYAEAARARAETGKKAPDAALLDVSGPDGKVIFTARNPDEAKAAKAHVAVVRDIMAKAKELKDKVAQGWTVSGSDRSAEMEALQADLMSKVRVAEEMGALDKGSQALAEKMIPTGMGWSRTGPARLDQFIKATRDSAAKKFDSFGIPGQKVVGFLERSDAGAAAGPAPNRTEYARVMDAYRRAPQGSPEQARLGQALQGMRSAMGH